MTEPRAVLLTVGHGTLDAQQLGDLLVGAGVEQLVDVRRYPGSRTNPAAQRPALEELAAERGFDYRWDERLGGRRELGPEERTTNPDTFWQVPQFRAYAGWTRSPEFRAGLEQLLGELPRARTAVMCSETVWWRCHRRLVAEVVQLETGTPALHLMHDGRRRPHPVSPGARLDEDGRVVWDRAEDRRR